MTRLDPRLLPFARLALWLGYIRDGLRLAALLIPHTRGGKLTNGERRSDA